MYRELERSIGELRVNHTDKEIAGTFSEYFRIVRNISEEYIDSATVRDIREDHHECNFMGDEEIEVILEQAKVMRRKREPHFRMDGYDVEFAEECIKAHMGAFEDWPYGNVKKIGTDGDGNLRIYYADGMYWHYKKEDGEIIWW